MLCIDIYESMMYMCLQPENYDYVSFNTTGKCEPPLVRTVLPESWYPGVEGCGIPCDNPLFSQDEHKRVHTFVAVFGSICLLCTLFTVVSGFFSLPLLYYSGLKYYDK